MKAKIEIKPARPDDAQAIASVLAESFAEYEPLYTAEAFAGTTPNSDAIEKLVSPKARSGLLYLKGKSSVQFRSFPKMNLYTFAVWRFLSH